jgi:hypothetical protein
MERAILPLLADREPLVKAAAAACAGRLGIEAAVTPLVNCLRDPSKIVWRSAAWSLRRLGNQGIGHAAIAAALKSPDRRTRRGAARVFAYQFYGMDERLELAEPLFELTRDPDLWTRLQAVRTLRQWFYRARDPRFARRVVDTYLARLGEPDLPLVRRNLSENLYIMLDENLGGGVSLQKNIAELPPEVRPGILEARRAFERDVLLEPVLATLRDGKVLARTGALAAFDGSFFRGRGYARRPPGMIDVGNDREFGFLWEPSLPLLEATFARLLTTELPDGPRSQAIQLAGFFDVPGRTQSATIQTALLRRLGDPHPRVRAAAREVVARDLTLSAAETDPERTRLIISSMERGPAELEALLQAVGRNERLANLPELMTAIRRLGNRDETAPWLMPVLRWPALRDVEVLSIVLHAWPRLRGPARLLALDAILGRPSLVDFERPREQVLQVLRRGMTDPSTEVRDRTLRGINALPALWRGRESTALLLAALADDSAELRRLGLTLASTKPGVWHRADAREYLKRLLVDPDPQVRLAALATIERHALIRAEPALARRVKALLSDPALAARATEVLAAAEINAASIQADIRLGPPRLLSFSTFRRTVNPLFYRPGPDGYACANCHGTHTILRIAPAEPPRSPAEPPRSPAEPPRSPAEPPGSPVESPGSAADALIANYNAALKVVNLGDPESSLIVRKPRSPLGQGGPEPSSPTGLSHAGGPRWQSTDEPAYRAILEWIREAARAAPSPGGIQRLSADSFARGQEPARAGDGDLATYWQTEFEGTAPGYPHEVVIDLGARQRIEGLLYVPRQDQPAGRVRDFEIRLSEDRGSWSEPISKGHWPNDPSFKYVELRPQNARYVQLRGVSEVEGRPLMSAAEIAVETGPPGDSGITHRRPRSDPHSATEHTEGAKSGRR